MQRRMSQGFEQCIKERKLVRINSDNDLILKELNAAKFDLKTAQKSAQEGNFKWATIQAYYSMFHTAKALVLSRGYREKSHLCLSTALKHLFVDAEILEQRHYLNFRDCMMLREDADYGLVYSADSTDGAISWASEFLQKARDVLF